MLTQQGFLELPRPAGVGWSGLSSRASLPVAIWWRGPSAHPRLPLCVSPTASRLCRKRRSLHSDSRLFKSGQIPQLLMSAYQVRQARDPTCTYLPSVAPLFPTLTDFDQIIFRGAGEQERRSGTANLPMQAHGPSLPFTLPPPWLD